MRAFLLPIPPAHRAGFERTIAYANWLHGCWVASAVAFVNAAFSLLPEIHYYRNGVWPWDRSHLFLTAMHGFMFVFSLLAVAVLERFKPPVAGLAGRRHEAIAIAYGVVMLATVTVFSIVEARVTGSISAFLFGIAAFATLFYTKPGASLAAMGACLTGLTFGSLWVWPDTRIVWHHVFVGFDAVILFWVGSRLGYYLKAVNYLQLVTIQQQAKALAESNAALARANEFKTDLLSLAAHDLRDPLSTIAMSAQTVRDELPQDSPLRPMAVAIDRSSRHLAEFVGNLLQEVTSDAHQLCLERVPTVLPELVADIVAQLRPVAEAKEIALHLVVTPAAAHAPAARVDRTCFRQVLENLVRNAVKYSPPRRNVWIELTHGSEGHRLSVRDEGPGLAPEDHARLFQRFQRLSAQPTRGENSSGLGLFIVKQLVSLHNGRVWAESAGPGRGATFVVVLP